MRQGLYFGVRRRGPGAAERKSGWLRKLLGREEAKGNTDGDRDGGEYLTGWQPKEFGED